MLRGLGSLSDGERRHAFVRTAKSVITPRGQRVAATDKLYLVADLPTLLVAGEHDHVIPVEHTRAAGRLAPGSRLEIFENSGHFPHLNEPERFADLVAGVRQGDQAREVRPRDRPAPDRGGAADGGGLLAPRRLRTCPSPRSPSPNWTPTPVSASSACAASWGSRASA